MEEKVYYAFVLIFMLKIALIFEALSNGAYKF